jgi:hypothetical protein
MSNTVDAWSSPVAPAIRADQAQDKARSKRMTDDWPKDLAPIVKNRIPPKLKSVPAFEGITCLTPAQQQMLSGKGWNFGLTVK